MGNLLVQRDLAAGTSYGSYNVPQCGTAYSSTGAINLPLGALQNYAADGTVTVVTRAGTSVTCSLCPTTSQVYATLQFGSLVQGTFL